MDGLEGPAAERLGRSDARRLEEGGRHVDAAHARANQRRSRLGAGRWTPQERHTDQIESDRVTVGEVVTVLPERFAVIGRQQDARAPTDLIDLAEQAPHLAVHQPDLAQVAVLVDRE